MKIFRILVILFPISLLQAQEWKDVSPHFGFFDQYFLSRGHIYSVSNSLNIIQDNGDNYIQKCIFKTKGDTKFIYMDDTLLVTARASNKVISRHSSYTYYEAADTIDFYKILNDSTFSIVKSLRIEKQSQKGLTDKYIWFSGNIIVANEYMDKVKWYNATSGLSGNIPIKEGYGSFAVLKNDLLIKTNDTLRVLNQNMQIGVSTSFSFNIKLDLTCAVENGSKVYIGTNKGVFSTENDYKKFNSFNNGLMDSSVLALHIWNDTLYAGTSSGNYTFTHTWNPFFTGIAYASPVLFHYKQDFFAGGIRGINYKRVNNLKWKNLLSNLPGIDIQQFAYNNGLLIGVGAYTIVTSDDMGETWSRMMTSVPGIQSNIFRTCIFASDNILYSGDDQGNMYSSSDRAKSWQRRSTIKVPNNNLNYSTNQLIFNQGKLFAACYSGLHYTEDLVNWKGAVYNDVTTVAYTSNGNLFYTDFDGNLSKAESLNSRAYSAYSSNKVTGIYFNNKMLYISEVGKGISISEDEGSSWREFNTGIDFSNQERFEKYIKILHAKDGNTLAINFNSGDIYLHVSGSNNWKFISKSPFNSNMSASILADNIIICSEGSRIYKLDLQKIITSIDNFSMPIEKVDVNVYPNPFNEKLNINSSNLKKYTLINNLGIKVFSGIHETIDLPKLENGSYIIQIELNDGTIVSKHLMKIN